MADTDTENMVALDFGADSTVEIVDGRVVVTTTPEKAMSFLSDQTVRDAIRHKVNKYHRKLMAEGKPHQSGVARPTALAAL